MTLLSVLIVTTLAAVAADFTLRHIQIKKLRQLADHWQMHYTPGDRFRLANRVAPRLTVPGAAMVRIEDVIYGREGDYYRYYFTAHYTTGVLKRKADERAVCTLTELKDRDRSQDPGPLQISTTGLTLVEQYENLHKTVTADQKEPKA